MDGATGSRRSPCWLSIGCADARSVKTHREIREIREHDTIAQTSGQQRIAWLVALGTAVAVLAFGLVRGTWAVGGSDSSCYALMADAFASGRLQPETALALEAPWPNASLTFAPAGFIPSPVRSAAASPICLPGFSLLLAPFRLVGGRDGIFVVTPLAGALLVILAFIFGRQLAGYATGVAAAVLVATIPVFLFQVTQPMNDVVVTTIWMGVLVAASLPDPTRPWVLGALTGLAVLVRPNLAPAAAIVGVWLLMTTARVRGATSGWLVRSALAFAVSALPFAAVLVALNTSLYGQPLGSGYGNTQDLFSVEHAMPNLRQYGRALLETQLGLPLLGLAAIVLIPRQGRPVAWLTIAVCASIAAVYLLYQPFPEWWYLRFLLPALAPMTVLAAASGRYLLASMIRWPAARVIAGAVLVTATATFTIDVADERHAFDLHRLESRFRRAGHVVRDRLPANAVFIAVWQSGTVRYHAGRNSLLWDSMDPGALETAVGWLSSRGLEPFLLVERWEEPLFRERFAEEGALGQLEWPPRFDIDRQVRIFSFSDRDRYARGDDVQTEYILR